MDTWVEQIHRQARVLQDQIFIARQEAERASMDLAPLIAAYQRKLESLYEEELGVARLLDRSDIIVHAEGPAAQHDAAMSHAVAWLLESVELRIRRLAMAALHLVNAQAKAANADLRVVLDGLAPGSLYLGFSVRSASTTGADLALTEPEPAIDTVRRAVRQLPRVPEFITDEAVTAGIADMIPDAELRDATLLAAYHLAPTGRRGIHTLRLGAPGLRGGTQALSARERTVLREKAVRTPFMVRRQDGEFIGELREVDLDANRFQLRGVPDVGTLRVALAFTADDARKWLGRGVRVRGQFEADADGRPRIMHATKVDALPLTEQLSLTESTP